MHGIKFQSLIVLAFSTVIISSCGGNDVAISSAIANETSEINLQPSVFCADEINQGPLSQLPNGSFDIGGLNGFKEDGEFSRLPYRVSSSLGDVKSAILNQTSGGIIAFQSDATHVMFQANTHGTPYPHMTAITASGVDIYIDNHYVTSAPAINGVVSLNINGLCSNDKLIEIYLPLFGTVQNMQISVNESAIAHRLVSESDIDIIYYGSSLTQGCCASNPGMSYQSIIYRENRIPYLNLGLAGQGVGDEEIAHYMVEMAPEIIVLDYWANPSVSVYENSLPKFVDILRASLPETYIVVTGVFYNPQRNAIWNQKDAISSALVAQLRDSGDDRIFFADNLIKAGETDGYVDGLHLNSYGFRLVGVRLSEFIFQNILSKF